ncbi:alpha/beta hydrolase [Paractinoplanes globisporus]|uniref:Alpha/beta hydrolase n=1 Tax=Paractinoplanes globisporus TaxID=113565 RepID=A0ABW6WGY2_9ACTN|nr:alpha/beta fold hydrolase [Actinoplanes globisporus]
MSDNLLRFEDWTSPVPAVEREVVSRLIEGETEQPPLLFIPGPGRGAWAFAEHWLGHAANRGFPAYALTPREGTDTRAHVHDVVQVAASLPRQAVLVGHGQGALVVTRALGRYPARAAVLAAPVMGRAGAIGAGFKANPFGTLPAVFGGRLRLTKRQLFSAALPADEADGYLNRMTFHRPLRASAPPRPVGDPPVLVVGSPDDRVVSRKSLDRTAAEYGGAPLLFPGMGHELMLDAGWAEPIDAILDWLTKELSAS